MANWQEQTGNAKLQKKKKWDNKPFYTIDTTAWHFGEFKDSIFLKNLHLCHLRKCQELKTSTCWIIPIANVTVK